MNEKHYSLSELGVQIHRLIQDHFSHAIWLVAEIAELREGAGGHCYMELVEKQEHEQVVTARLRATIWTQQYRMIKPYFETSTGELFRAGLKVLLQVTVQYHEVYGMSVQVKDIEPSFTLGESARKRKQILRQLEEEGCLSMNRELELCALPQRVAIISAEGAAGYGDFMKHLHNNQHGYAFYTQLFPALMQGAGTESSVIHALDCIGEELENFDLVILIRGGGAAIDLATFDNYNIAVNLAQFPLPVVVGIGHDRDETVLDCVAYKSVKTPTAAAEFLIQQFDIQQQLLNDWSKSVSRRVGNIIHHEKGTVGIFENRMRNLAKDRLRTERERLKEITQQMRYASDRSLAKKRHVLNLYEQKAKLLDPQLLLKKGYSQTLVNGRPVNSIQQIKAGEEVCTIVADGSFRSIII